MSRKAVLFLNLGSPDSPAVPDVRRYLTEFLMDPRVMDAPLPVRWPVVHLRILPKRSAASARLYSKIWTPDGSPLIAISRAFQEHVQQHFDFPVELAMRYGNPATSDVLRTLHERNVQDLLLFPLYPHYAMSSWETALVKATDEIAQQGYSFRVSVVQPFYSDPEYVHALIQNARPHLDAGFDRLIFSFHGVPERHLRRTDPSHAHCLKTQECCDTPHPAHATCYRHQCLQTARLFAELAGLPGDCCHVSFQSRLGRDPWLTPFTEDVLRELGQARTGRVLVICPAFVADCLETLEEIAMGGRRTFQEAGGGEFEMIPCLNTHSAWIRFAREMIRKWASGDLSGISQASSEPVGSEDNAAVP